MINCKECGELTSNKVFCSRSCNATNNNKNNNRWKDYPTKKKTQQRVCLNCNNTYYGQNEKFCSNNCKYDYAEKEILAGNGYRIAVRNYLLKKDPSCQICKLANWNNKPISLEMDHIDGDCKNNKLENVRLLCPNCHSQTDTFRVKNKGNSSRVRYQYY